MVTAFVVVALFIGLLLIYVWALQDRVESLERRLAKLSVEVGSSLSE